MESLWSVVAASLEQGELSPSTFEELIFTSPSPGLISVSFAVRSAHFKFVALFGLATAPSLHVGSGTSYLRAMEIAVIPLSG